MSSTGRSASGTPSAGPPRVRIAPSPTGDPHVGTAYIGLFNYAFARRHGGTFVLRVEDTDRARSTESSERAIYEALRWVGLTWDEGPDVGGPFGPYRQSERSARYREAADLLIEKGSAYRCFCTRERLDGVRKEQEKARQTTRYDGLCRGLTPEESRRRADAGEAHTVRLAVPRPGTTVVHDGLRGEVTFDHEQVDDQVLLKSDGFPTYHLAVVVDDHHMEISHVIRGEDWLPSTPKHILLYQAFGWDEPQWWHVSLLRNPDGSKLSKRKNPVSIFHYRDAGFMPETFVNFLGTLGHSMADGRERFTLDEMIASFELSSLRAGGPVFDPQKLTAFSGDDIRALEPDDLLEKIRTRVLDPKRLAAILALSRERISTLDEFVPYVSFFFGGSVDYRPVEKALRKGKKTPQESAKLLAKWVEGIEKDAEARAFTPEALEAFSRRFCEAHDVGAKQMFTLLRVGATGRTAAPPLFDTLAVLGKDRVRMRLRDAGEFLRALRPE